jgi:predicted dienelactone hydrolase
MLARLPARGLRLWRTTAPLAVAGVCVLAGCGGGAPRLNRPRSHTAPGGPAAASAVGRDRASSGAGAPRHRAAGTRGHGGSGSGGGPFAVGLRVLHIVDHRRTIALPDGVRRPRPITTLVRYPALGPAHGRDLRDAPPARAAGPFPLVVFGHGFAVTPAIYSGLLRAWAAAGFVVAAPVFPLENARAPGGPDERDLPNQPQDMRVVIDRLLGADARPHGWASRLIERRRIAVAGQSDGGETALALAYDRAYRDPRVRAAVLLSGAQLPAGGPASLVPRGPPLLAVQGSADAIDPPERTRAFFAAVHAPKFLLTLIGASHLAPYTTEQPQLSIVERVSTAFLRTYLGPGAQEHRSLGALHRVASRPGLASLLARP